MSNKIMSDRRLLLARWALGLTFAYAGGVKLTEPPRFLEMSIARMDVVPSALVAPLAASLPVYELLASLWLLTGWRTRAAALALLTLSCVFVAALTLIYARGLPFDCACFGGSAPTTSISTALLRDILLLGLAAGIFMCAPSAHASRQVNLRGGETPG